MKKKIVLVGHFDWKKERGEDGWDVNTQPRSVKLNKKPILRPNQCDQIGSKFALFVKFYKSLGNFLRV